MPLSPVGVPDHGSSHRSPETGGELEVGEAQGGREPGDLSEEGSGPRGQERAVPEGLVETVAHLEHETAHSLVTHEDMRAAAEDPPGDPAGRGPLDRQDQVVAVRGTGHELRGAAIPEGGVTREGLVREERSPKALLAQDAFEAHGDTVASRGTGAKAGLPQPCFLACSG